MREYDKKKVIVSISALIVFVLVGGVFGAMTREDVTFCTERACLVDNNETKSVACNICGRTSYLFYISFINLVENCNGSEIWLFENGKHVDTNYDFQDECSYDITFGE